jgi:hypothetical protein
MQTDSVLKKGLYFKKMTIIVLALIALLVSVSPYVVMIIQIKTSQNTQTQAPFFERIYWDSGWLVSLCLSVLVLLKIKNIESNKKQIKLTLLLISIISILFSCLWALIFLIILPQFPPP